MLLVHGTAHSAECSPGAREEPKSTPGHAALIYRWGSQPLGFGAASLQRGWAQSRTVGFGRQSPVKSMNTCHLLLSSLPAHKVTCVPLPSISGDDTGPVMEC